MTNLFHYNLTDSENNLKYLRRLSLLAPEPNEVLYDSSNKVCMPKKYFYIIFIILILFILYQIWIYYFFINNKNIKNITFIETDITENNIIKIDPTKKETEPTKKETEPTKKETEPTKKETEPNADLVTLKKYLDNRDKSILSDPFAPPERRVSYDQYFYTNKNMINIPSRGYPDSYQVLGILSKVDETNKNRDHEKIHNLFGRATYPGSNEYEYYTESHQRAKIMINNRRKRELENNDIIEIPPLLGKYKVTLYNYDTPRYNPFNY